MFRKLCGDRALRNVVIVTNMWGEVDVQVGEAREAELKGGNVLFKPALEEGARMARHENTVPSAERIIRLTLDRDPLPLRIQRELVDERKNITQTRAGHELNRELHTQISKYKGEIWILMGEMQQAINVRDQETRKERKAEIKRMQCEIKRMQCEVEKFENDAMRLVSDYRREKEELEARLAEAEREAGDIIAQYQEEIDRLDAALRANAAASEAEKAQMRDRIKELSSAGRTGANGYLLALAVSARSVVVGPALGALGALGAITTPIALKLNPKFFAPSLTRVRLALWKSPR